MILPLFDLVVLFRSTKWLSVAPFDIFVYQFLFVFVANTVMYSDFGLYVREQTFQSIIGIGKACFRIVVERPQQRHVALYAQIGAA